MTRKQVEAKFRRDLKQKGRIGVIAGVFGEMPGCDGYVEEIIKPPEGGTFVKIYGCSYLSKGYPDSTRVFGLQLAKSLLSHFPHQMPLYLAFLFIFRRKRFLKLAQFVADEIDHKVTRHYDIPEQEYNRPVRELKRAMDKALSGSRSPWVPVIQKLWRFACLVLELDNAYRYRAQDALRMGPFQTFAVLIARETKKGIAGKWRFAKACWSIMQLLSPDLEQIVGEFFLYLDLGEIRMDEADRYFSLSFDSYNFQGLPLDDRLTLKHRIDTEKGHVFLV